MHYGAKSFSRNGKDTVKIIDPTVKVTLGQRTGLSDTDAKQLALLYKCRTGIHFDRHSDLLFSGGYQLKKLTETVVCASFFQSSYPSVI